MSREAFNLDKLMRVRTRLEKWDTLAKDRGEPEKDPRCIEIIEIVDHPDGRREFKRLKGD